MVGGGRDESRVTSSPPENERARQAAARAVLRRLGMTGVWGFTIGRRSSHRPSWRTQRRSRPWSTLGEGKSQILVHLVPHLASRLVLVSGVDVSAGLLLDAGQPVLLTRGVEEEAHASAHL